MYTSLKFNGKVRTKIDFCTKFLHILEWAFRRVSAAAVLAWMSPSREIFLGEEL